jgi:hypothetical protein
MSQTLGCSAVTRTGRVFGDPTSLQQPRLAPDPTRPRWIPVPQVLTATIEARLTAIVVPLPTR